MHSPEDHVDPRGAYVHGRVAPPPAVPSLKDAAGWQALYTSMLGHITGNVEVWLRNYLTQMMAAGQGPSVVPPHAAAGAAMKLVIPPWLEPFKDPDNVRFTRTPDHILMQERGVWTQLLATNDDRGPQSVSFEPEPVQPVDAQPERRSYVLPPNVRNTRTPDRLLAKQDPAMVDGMQATEYDPLAVPTVSVAEVPLESLVADAFETARAAEQNEEQILAVAAAIIEEAWAEVAPQPWGDVIQLGPVEVPPLAMEQGNARDALASFLVRWSEDLPASFEQGDVGEVDDELQIEAQDEPEQDRDRVVEADADRLDALMAAAPVEHVIEPVASPETVEGVARIEVAAEPPPAASEALHPIVTLPDNALHLSFLGAPNQPRTVRRPRVAGIYERPPLDLLTEPPKQTGTTVTRDALEQNARLLEGVLEDFGIRGEIINVRPGPVVTLYELEPAPGIKSSRVVGLADDIARSMSAVSARVAVVQGRNAIGIELPNQRRDTVFLRELMAQPDFERSTHKLAIALGKTIGGEPVIVDLARMPHLLVAGTTGSGKSVAINTMILSLLYRLRPDECRLIMVDPKMLELSIYDGIPHLLTPVVTDPKKAVVALKWAVREMEDRYKKMSKVGVRNIDGFNARVSDARAKGEAIVRTVHTGFDRLTGQATYANEEMDLTVLPYIVVIVDEMADLMMVAGKDIEGAIQRLAQMARAAGIHLIMATQRPSVDVITGTIKANFPTRISFQVTSKIDSRTILGEQGAEQLLGQGDMLHMVGGGRIARVHGPFVSDAEVEAVVAHLKAQGQPDYLDVTTEEGEAGTEAAEGEDGAPGEDGAVFDKSAMGGLMGGGEDGELYDQAVKIVLRDKKCSTSYIQRRLSVGYNKAASLVEKMEKEGIVGPANHAGKREILIYSRDMRAINVSMPEEEDDARD